MQVPVSNASLSCSHKHFSTNKDQVISLKADAQNTELCLHIQAAIPVTCSYFESRINRVHQFYVTEKLSSTRPLTHFLVTTDISNPWCQTYPFWGLILELIEVLPAISLYCFWEQCKVLHSCSNCVCLGLFPLEQQRTLSSTFPSWLLTMLHTLSESPDLVFPTVYRDQLSGLAGLYPPLQWETFWNIQKSFTSSVFR